MILIFRNFVGTNLQASVPERRSSRVRGLERNVRTLYDGQKEETRFPIGETQQFVQECKTLGKMFISLIYN